MLSAKKKLIILKMFITLIAVMGIGLMNVCIGIFLGGTLNLILNTSDRQNVYYAISLVTLVWFWEAVKKRSITTKIEEVGIKGLPVFMLDLDVWAGVAMTVLWTYGYRWLVS